jgi:ATP-dependent helicase/nuclease subunit A
MSTFTPSQALAIAARGNVLVSAGAGTGKTRTVVERCLRLIDEGHSLENILMVTFTEAAAAEMRARLRKTLEEKLARTSDEAARLIVEQELALLDTAHISTLHSFCLELVRDHFHELHIDPQVAVLDEAQSLPLMHATLDALFDACYRGEVEFARDVQALIRHYGGGSDERVRALVIKLHRYTQSLPPSEHWYDRELARLATEGPAHWRAEQPKIFREWKAEWLPQLQRFEECDNIAACVAALQNCPANGSIDAVRAALQGVFRADKEKEWNGKKGEFRKPLEKFFDEALFLRSLVEPRDGRDPLVDDWNWMRVPMCALLRLTRRFTEDFAGAKRAQGGVDFADLEQLALRLLVDDSGAPTDIARTWQQRFHFVFVDECQDINAAQDAIIRAVGQSAGNRFLVGDVKQSIYRFRLADPAIFRRYEELWRTGQGGQRIALADNFRSREVLLNFINPLFAALMRPAIGGVGYEDDARLRFGNADERPPLAASADPAPRVELHVIHKVKNGDENGADESEDVNGDSEAPTAPVEDVLAIEREARLVAKRLHELREGGHEIWDESEKRMRPVDWRDMVVLLRSPGPRVETFAKEFSRAGVPLAAARAGFYSAVEILDLLHLLKLLDNPLQDLPLAAVLRSPLVGLSIDELAAVRIAGNGERHSTFFAAASRMLKIDAQKSGPAAFVSAQAKLRAFFDQFGRWRALVRQTSVSHCLETVLAETHYEALLLAQPRGRERIANVHRLLELARQYDPYQRQGLFRFLRFIEEQEEAELDQEAANVETENAVRLMSIHKSKGLEFPVVVVACLAAPFNTQDLREDILLSADEGLCAKIIPPHIDQRYPSLPWWVARRREMRELLGEEMRLLYVAMTRARDTLILMAFDKTRAGGARWHLNESLLDDQAILKSQSYFGWIRRWLAGSTNDANWTDDLTGGTDWLRWTMYPEVEVRAPVTKQAVAKSSSENDLAESFDLDSLRARLTWTYPSLPATMEPAKTNVSVLRRRAAEPDEDARQLFASRRRSRRAATLTAAEIGSAHHVFLQHVELDRTTSVLELRNQAGQFIAAGLLSPEEAAALDFDALLAFWLSDIGRRVVSEQSIAHRELPFTARFRVDELRALGFPAAGVDAAEFVIVQGVVDLALVGSKSIELVDFKTDGIRPGEEREKAQFYEPQIKLYAAALKGIYGRPVRSAALHFLATGETREISLS